MGSCRVKHQRIMKTKKDGLFLSVPVPKNFLCMCMYIFCFPCYTVISQVFFFFHSIDALLRSPERFFDLYLDLRSEKELTWADLDELSLLNLHLLSSPHIALLCPLLFSLQRFLSTALRDSFRERQQLDPASSQALDGPPGSTPTPGMTISHRGPSSQPTAASSTGSSAALAPNFGHSLCHHSSSG